MNTLFGSLLTGIVGFGYLMMCFAVPSVMIPVTMVLLGAAILGAVASND